MHTFDSAKVTVELRPQDIEALLNLQTARPRPADTEVMTQLALTYADHSRVCALLSSGLERVLRPFGGVFAQVTINAGPWQGWDHEDPVQELDRRFIAALGAIGAIA